MVAAEVWRRGHTHPHTDTPHTHTHTHTLLSTSETVDRTVASVKATFITNKVINF